MTTHPADGANPLEQVLYEVKRVIVGQDELLERMAVALLAGGHLVVEGVPGLAKTLAVKSLASAIGGQFQRTQFTPDLVPADVVGSRVYHQHTGEFATTLGPVFANLLLADEINRAPAKVQSALLEVMQERQVTIGRETFRVPDPFLVMATQNPIENEGTYPLPEAQVDRFMMKVLIGYPTGPEEHAVVERSLRPAEAVQAILQPAALVGMQRAAAQVYVDPAIVDYAVRLVAATRSPGTVGLGELDRYVTFGASPRASIALVHGARALAFLRGRAWVLPQDLAELALDVLRLKVAGGTSLGDAILTALSAITGKTVQVGEDGTAPDVGYWPSATIVLFSDGEDQQGGTDATVAATVAQTAGVHVETVGVGTAAGTTVEVDGYRVHTALDEDALTTIAQTTGGSYHPASDAAELDGIASGIDLRLERSDKPVPLAGAASALALVLLGAGAVLTVARTGRIV